VLIIKRHFCKKNICEFLHFQIILEKTGKFAAFIARPKAKSVSASGGKSPLHPLTRGSVPGSC